MQRPLSCIYTYWENYNSQKVDIYGGGDINIDCVDINCSNFKHTCKSPLSRAYKLVREIMPSDENVFLNRKPQLLKPLPIYFESFPSNICVKSNESLLLIDNKDYRYCYRFYTDGSCIPNPGPGASAFYSDNFSIVSKSRAANHDTTINSMELDAIDLVFESLIIFAREQTINNNHFMRKAAIFSDSLFVCNLLSIDGYPHYAYYYEQMNEIIHKANILDEDFNFKIEIIKVKSHVNIAGNVKADEIAKEKAKWALLQKKNGMCFYNTYFNPIMVDIAYLKSKLDIKYCKIRRKEWNERMDNIVHANIDQSNNLFYGSEFLFDRIMFKEGKLMKRSNLMRNELKHLSQKEGEIINKLRTEQINLNYYKYYFHEKRKKREEQRTDGSCIHCNRRENVSHFILECEFQLDVIKSNKIKIARNNLFAELRKHTIFFRNGFNRTIENILFPHYWQLRPDWKDPMRKEKIETNLMIRVKILKSIVKFVIASERFKDEEFGF